jgi:hypothetical protein
VGELSLDAVGLVEPYRRRSMPGDGYGLVPQGLHRALDQHHAGAAVRNQLRQFACGKAPVEHGESAARLGARDQREIEVGRIEAEETDPVARTDPAGDEGIGDTVRGPVVFGERDVALPIDQRAAIGRVAGVILDEFAHRADFGI